MMGPACYRQIGQTDMTYCHTFLPGPCFSSFGLDPDTPVGKYEIGLIRSSDPAYPPLDSSSPNSR